MSKTAYLVACLFPGRTFELGIFSEPHPTVCGDRKVVVVMEAEGPDYLTAKRRLMDEVKRCYPWFLPIEQENDR